MILSKKFSATIIYCLFLCLSTNKIYSQLDTIPANNEKAFLLNSKILNEPRSIWIHLPSDYISTKQTYPVIYLLDGDGHFKYVSELVDYLSGYDRNRIPEMIVVGIVNVDRGRDLTPVHTILANGKNDSNSISTTAGAGKFLQFIKDELVPYIDGNYRTQPYRVLMGHSLAGQFAFYTKNEVPELFKATILISPAFHGDNQNLLNDFPAFLKNHPQLSGKLFITIGNENTQKVDLLTQQLKASAPKSFIWSFRKYDDENHFSVSYKSMFDALKFIYANWFINFYDTTKMSYKEIQIHFEKLSDEFGYNIKPNEEFVNSCGYTQLRLGNIKGAINIFQHNIENFPNSFNVYDSMGEAYMANGEKELAITNYEKSISLNPNNDNGKSMLKKLRSK